MPVERFYHPQRLERGSPLSLEEQEFHHLVHVIRTRQGDPIEIINGSGQLARGIVASIEKRRAAIDIVNVTEEPPANYTLILAQAIPRINRLENILEKATELGATEIWLFTSKHSERKGFTEHQVERLRAITIAAIKQCGRLHLPKLIICSSIDTLPKFPGTAFFGEVSNGPIPSLASSWKETMRDVIVCIGPESGLTSDEETLLKQRGALGVTLHPNILRTDTAAIASLSILSHLITLP